MKTSIPVRWNQKFITPWFKFKDFHDKLSKYPKNQCEVRENREEIAFW